MAAEGEMKPRMRREQEWVPTTNLGRLVKLGKVTSMEQIFRSSLKIQEPEIVDHLLGKSNLKEDIICIKSVQKQSKAGQKTSMKVCVVVGNGDGYVGLGTHSSRELSTSIKGALRQAKINIIPVRKGQWDGENGVRHTVNTQASGKCGSVTVKVVPAPMGSGIEASRIHKSIFALAGIQDIFVKSYGCTKTSENMAKATIQALENSSNMFTPADWEAPAKVINPLVEHSDLLAQFSKVTL